ncbi:MAG: tetratricopeptide repeat protein, partial [Candidatus Eisenbacteria bacterium]
MKLAEGAFPDAIVLLEEAAQIRRSSLPGDTAGLAGVLVSLGRAEKNAGHYDEATARYEEVLRMTQGGGGPLALCRAEALAGTANVIRRKPEQLGEATRLMAMSLAIRERWLGREDLSVADARTDLALLYYLVGRVESARREAEEALRVRRPRLGPGNPDLGLSESILAWSLVKLGRRSEADRHFAIAVANYERARLHSEMGPSRLRYRPMVAAARAANLLDLGKPDEAWQVLERGLSVFMMEWLRPPSPPAARHAGPPAVDVASLSEVQRSLS